MVSEVATVLVDAENVRRSRWPNLSREELVERCGAWAREHGHEVVVVFDGRAPDVDGAPDCELVSSGAESADDRIVQEGRVRSERGPVWLVTSDRALRARAAGVERTIGGGAFVEELVAR